MFRRLLNSAAAALVTVAASPRVALAAIQAAAARVHRALRERRHLRAAARQTSAEDHVITTAEAYVSNLYQVWYAPYPGTGTDPHVIT